MPKILFALLLLTQITQFGCTTKKEEQPAQPAPQEVAATNEYPNILLRLTDGNELQAKVLRAKPSICSIGVDEIKYKV